MRELKTNWMGLKLKNPLILASLTLFSKVTIDEHYIFLKNAIKEGAAAVVLPSINPSKKTMNLTEETVVEAVPFNSGISSSKYIGFTVFGPPKSNIVASEYGTELLKKLVSARKDEKIIASIANIGSKKDFLYSVKEAELNGADGIELNFSCPNVITMNQEEGVTNLTLDILKEIRNCTKLPISLKLSPNYDHTELLNCISNEINGITISNAFLGLMPPNLELECMSPFSQTEYWCPTGVYGPQELMITYYNLYRYGKIARSKGISISCVGGITTGEQAVQSLLLGANTVQFSSAIAWKGLKIFYHTIEFINDFMAKNDFLSINDFYALALKKIKSGADEIQNIKKKRIRTVDQSLCKHCSSCNCVNHLCLALKQEKSIVTINPELCNGCGWCSVLCLNNAIKII